MADDVMQAGWKKAEGLIEQGEMKQALESLRELDAKGKYANTMSLAGEAKWRMARQGSKPDVKLYRESVSHLRSATKLDPKSKKSRNTLHSLLNEMQNKGIRETFIPKMINDGTPTVWGISLVIGMIIVSAVGIKQFMTEDESMIYSVELHVSWMDHDQARNGVIKLELYYDDAPIHVENFIAHAKTGNYDGTVFHRIIADFMIQGGDFENGDGSGGYAADWYGYCDGKTVDGVGTTYTKENCPDNTRWTIPDEADNGLTHAPYALAMAKTNAPHTGGSQFYIVDGGANPEHLDGVHTVFGMVTSGFEYVDSISEVQTNQDRPMFDVTITKVVLVEI